MQAKKKRGFLSSFFSKNSVFPLTVAIAAGLYPLLFYYTNNFKMINSWAHLGYFVLIFLLFPSLVFFVVNRITETSKFSKLKPFALPFLNLFYFLFFLTVALYADFSIINGAIAFALSAGLTFLITRPWAKSRKAFNKIIVFQYLLAIIGFITLTPVVIEQLNYSVAWKLQPDAIETAVFKKKPNIYFIQPDGYANFSELKKGFYNIQNAAFEDYLEENNFTNYPNFRSNYASTLATNSAVFMMKHHYYNKGSDFTEVRDARNVIITDNSVLRILKNNGYRTFFVTEQPYFMTNKPKMGYDFCNFSPEEIKFITTGIGNPKDVIEPFKNYLEEYPDGPNFFFIEIFNPGHITNTIADSKGIEGERQHYIESLKESNKKLTQLTTEILKKDPEALIVIMADHGGFVGMTNTQETIAKNQNRDFLHSVFSSILAIHWPKGEEPEFNDRFKSSVNLFRILTAYLSDDLSYLDHLQEDKSYLIISEDAPNGVYECLGEQGEVIFNKHR